MIVLQRLSSEWLLSDCKPDYQGTVRSMEPPGGQASALETSMVGTVRPHSETPLKSDAWDRGQREHGTSVGT